MRNERLYDLMECVHLVLTKVGMGWGDDNMILPDSHGCKEEFEARLIEMKDASHRVLKADLETPTECFSIWCNENVEAVSFGSRNLAGIKMCRLREVDYQEVKHWSNGDFEAYSKDYRWHIRKERVV